MFRKFEDYNISAQYLIFRDMRGFQSIFQATVMQLLIIIAVIIFIKNYKTLILCGRTEQDFRALIGILKSILSSTYNFVVLMANDILNF